MKHKKNLPQHQHKKQKKPYLSHKKEDTVKTPETRLVSSEQNHKITIQDTLYHLLTIKNALSHLLTKIKCTKSIIEYMFVDNTTGIISLFIPEDNGGYYTLSSPTSVALSPDLKTKSLEYSVRLFEYYYDKYKNYFTYAPLYDSHIKDVCKNFITLCKEYYTLFKEYKFARGMLYTVFLYSLFGFHVENVLPVLKEVSLVILDTNLLSIYLRLQDILLFMVPVEQVPEIADKIMATLELFQKQGIPCRQDQDIVSCINWHLMIRECEYTNRTGMLLK
jgi:hypothetical protein